MAGVGMKSNDEGGSGSRRDTFSCGILFLALRGFFFYNNLRQRIEEIHRNIYYFFQEDLT